MVTTTDVVERKSPFRDTYRRHGYFFKEAAILTIFVGFGLHLYRVIFGDELTLQYVVTPTTDKVLMVPMTYAAVHWDSAVEPRRFANNRHTGVVHGSLVYIAAACRCTSTADVVRGNVDSIDVFPVWFS